MDDDKIVEITESVVGAVAEELPGASKRIKGFLDDLNEKKPEIASGLMVASKICKAGGDYTGCLPLTLIGICLAGASNVLNPEDQDDSSSVVYQTEFRKIHKKLSLLEEKADKILDILQEMLRKGGMKKIRAQFKGMLEKSNQLKMWADQFHHNVSSFYLNREDFDPQNLSTIFGQVYESKCDKNFAELNEIYDYVLTSRLLYLQIMITYHTNVDRFDPTIRERAILDEIDNCNKDILQISQCMSKVCNIFHPVRALPKDSHFDPAYIPTVTVHEEFVLKKLGIESGKVYGNQDFMVLLPDLPMSIYGKKLTAKCTVRKFKTYLVKGPARMETDEKIYIGKMNESGRWIGGRIEIDNDSPTSIEFRKYRDGKKIPNSTRYYYDFEWHSSPRYEKSLFTLFGAKFLDDHNKRLTLSSRNSFDGSRNNSAQDLPFSTNETRLLANSQKNQASQYPKYSGINSAHGTTTLSRDAPSTSSANQETMHRRTPFGDVRQGCQRSVAIPINVEYSGIDSKAEASSSCSDSSRSTSLPRSNLSRQLSLQVNPGARSFNIPIRVEGQEEATQTNVREATMQKTNSLRRGVSLQERSRVVVNGRQIDIQSNDTLEEEVGNDVNRGRTIQLNINL